MLHPTSKQALNVLLRQQSAGVGVYNKGTPLHVRGATAVARGCAVQRGRGAPLAMQQWSGSLSIPGRHSLLVAAR